jgi:transcriptional regulator with XRE-family HTH domain
MGWKFNSPTDIHDLAERLGNRRKKRGLTLQQIEKATGINCAQLSRFETGTFKTASKNLQILCGFLQISLTPASGTGKYASISLAKRIEKFAARSNGHRLAAEEILAALERLK